jgi:membrane fusion protein, multidrug efflux system
MQVRSFRRQFQGLWRQLSRLVAPILVIEVLLLVFIARAEAATPVALQQIHQTGSFEAVRLYAGRTAPGRASDLGFKQPGELATVLVDEGSRVVQGQVLAHQDTAALDAALRRAQAEVTLAAANVLAARAHADLARQTEARWSRLRVSGHVSEQHYDEQRLAASARSAELAVAEAGLASARAAQASAEIALREASLRAPFAGTIQARHHDEGTQVGAGEPVLRLIGSGRVKALVGVPESQMLQLTVGASYPLHWNGQIHAADLTAILPEVDAQTRTVTAVLELADDRIPLGAVVELRLNQAVASTGFWLPLTALAESDRGLWGVYVVNDTATLERRLVEILHSDAERAFVRGTLRDGERIVVTGVQRLVPGQQVEAADQG